MKEQRNAEAREIDRYVGARIQARRLELNQLPAQLGPAVGVTGMQVVNYERGYDRVSSGRLYLFARELGVSPAYFYEGLA